MTEQEEIFISGAVMNALIDAKKMIEISGLKIAGFKLKGEKLYMQIEDILIEDAITQDIKKKN